MSERAKHLKLQQVESVHKQGESAYVIIEARNTVRWPVGQVLSRGEVEGLPAAVSYTVVGPKR